MASTKTQAGQTWHNALKFRKSVLRSLERLSDDSSGVDLSYLNAVNKNFENFRLACVQTIFIDFEYAVEQHAEACLWGLHLSMNAEYRRKIDTVRDDTRPVERRKVQSAYHHFLRISQRFYKGYIQRLSARYNVVELKGVVKGIEIEEMGSEDAISPVPHDLARLVLESCHATLIHLGDLARYRVQASRRNLGYEAALTYYALARRLIPHSGVAFHQIGIVNLSIDKSKHLDAVYYFYRALVVEIPHPQAKFNLESELKALRLPNCGRPSASEDVFCMWFTKLHAFFYVGDIFTQQKEMEDEVMHRLDMACRDTSCADILLKMALVNMSAYDLASQALSEVNTGKKSRFWKFTLRFNALFLLHFCGSLNTQLNKAVSDATENSSDLTPSGITSTIGDLLPTLRIYCIWLASHRQELLSASDGLEPVIPIMMQNMVKVFTLLCSVTHNWTTLAPCTYLLSEDLEVRGNRCLSGDQVPRACRVYCSENGNIKLYNHNPQLRLEDTQENLARVLDILRCAYFLAEDDQTPVTCQVVDSQLVFEYRPEMDTGSTSDATTALSQVGNSTTGQEKETVHHAQPEQVQHSEQMQHTSLLAQDILEEQEELPATTSSEMFADDDGVQQTVMAMLSPFLKPPTPRPQQRDRSPDDSWCSVDGASANGNSRSSPAYHTPNLSRFSGSVALFSLAWDNLPKPNDVENAATLAGKKAFIRGCRSYSPQERTAAQSPEDSFMALGQGATRSYAINAPDTLTAGHLRRTSGFAAERAHRDQFWQNLTANNAPRSSSLTAAREIAEQGKSEGKAVSRWMHQAQVLDCSDTTSFSNLSSLYMGTPTKLIGLGVSSQGRPAHITAQRRGHVTNESPSASRVQLSDASSHLHSYRRTA